MEPLALKKSCDSCTLSKVKCTGEYPCSRCTSKGIQCFYSPRKKRGAPKKIKRTRPDGPLHSSTEYVHTNPVIITKPSFDATGSLGSLGDWERRSWSVFFTLYKHYGTSCSLHWFNRQLNKMKSYLQRQGNKAALRRLTAWMEALNIDIDGLAASVERCHIKCFREAAMVSLHVKGKIK